MTRKINRNSIERFVSLLEKEQEGWQAPVVTLVAKRGATPYEILVSTLLSLRTKDEVTAVATERLLEKARTPQEMLALGEAQIESLIRPVGFAPTKAKRLRQVSRILMEQYHGRVPDDLDALLALPGVGRKTANLVLSEAFGLDAICVDTHVHRISNRIGLVKTRTPEATEEALRRVLPRNLWQRYNPLLVAFGQVICRPVSPFCSTCPVRSLCPRLGVGTSR
jgi:endonuclease-3